MIKAKLVKPIPKYIEKQIRSIDKIENYKNIKLRFYSYLTKMQGELVKITVAVKNNRDGSIMIKQVAVHGVDSKIALVRDMEYCYLGIYAYKVGWFQEGYKYPHGRPQYNDGVWHEVESKYYDPVTRVINEEYALTLKEYKYSGLEYANCYCPILYLKLYKEFPQLEYMAKLGLYSIGTSKTILKLVGKDKKFIKWLIQNKEQLRGKYYYSDVIIKAYKTKRPLKVLQKERKMKYRFSKDGVFHLIKEKLSQENTQKLMYYLEENFIPSSSYYDYFNACEHLNIDMTEEKNLIPHDFRYWHDLRIDQYYTQKALLDAEEKKTMYTKFSKIANKYINLEHDKRSAYVCIIAKSPEELLKESNILHHCVGHSNYDKRFIREESLIFFIRPKESLETPFVTLEYSLAKHEVLQCRGEHNSRPSEEVLHYVNKIWLPHANKQIKRIAA